MKCEGYFGEYGGQFIPEVLMPAIDELKEAYFELKDDEDFQNELSYYLKNYAGRETPLVYSFTSLFFA